MVDARDTKKGTRASSYRHQKTHKFQHTKNGEFRSVESRRNVHISRDLEPLYGWEIFRTKAGDKSRVEVQREKGNMQIKKGDPEFRYGHSWSMGKALLMDIVVPMLVMMVIVVSVRVFVVNLYVIPSGSMLDTLQIGDRVMTSRLSPHPFELKRGDVVVFSDPGNWLGSHDASGNARESSDNILVKRLIGLPGDRVQCCTANGKISINNQEITETDYIRQGVDPSDIKFDVTVPEDHIFVLGDNRSNSADSRYHLSDETSGMVPIENVQGVGKLVFWPLSHFHFLARPDSVYAKVPNPS